jgi:hypothetical protein
LKNYDFLWLILSGMRCLIYTIKPSFIYGCTVHPNHCIAVRFAIKKMEI